MGRCEIMAKQKRPWFHAYVISALRRIWRWSPERKTCYKAAQLSDTKYQCAVCKKGFTRKQVAVDHINPVVDPARGFEGWDNYISRLFCTAADLQVLCDPCHDAKTAQERKLRKKAA